MPKRQPQVVALNSSKNFKRLLKGIPFTAGMKAGLVTLFPKDSVGEHSTTSKEEVLLILSGKAQISYGARYHLRACARELVYLPPQTKHDVKNIGKNKLQYVYITSPVFK